MRRRVIIGVLLAVLLAMVWWFFFISPRNASIAQAGDDLRAAQDQQMALAAQADQLRAIRDSEVEYLAGIGEMETLIPERPLLDEFIEDLYALCGTTGVELLNLAPAMPVAVVGSSLRQITVAVTIDGDFFEVLGFLFGVMDMDRLVRVDAISLSSSQDATGATSLSASLNLRLFTLADLVPVTLPADAGTGTTDGSTGGDTTPEAQTTIVPSSVTSISVPSGEG
jgi:Tfp pilus assembly protein PilO